jgi:hypothetical protein
MYSSFLNKGSKETENHLWKKRIFLQVMSWNMKFRSGKSFVGHLRKEDQQFLDQLFEKARLHAEAGVSVSRPWPFETILISILLEHEKALAELKSKLKTQERQEK